MVGLLLLTLAALVHTLSSFKISRTSWHLESRYIHMGADDRDPADSGFLSRFAKAFLPTPEDIGLKRYDKGSRPENYPATKTEFAILLPSDGKPFQDDRAIIRPLLANTNLESKPLQLLYSANTDGWKASAFHQRVDKKGPAVVLARSVSGGVFGGYNPTGWVNYGEYRGSIAAFLFLYTGGNVQDRPIKLQKISGAGLAQVDDGGGPRFGAEGLTIPLQSSRPKLVRSKLGLYYELLPGGGKSLLPNLKGEDELTDLKVYGGVYAPGERIPYSDAMPFSLN